MTLSAAWHGRLPYRDGAALMRSTADARREGTIGDTVLLLEHEHVYTLGRRGSTADILLDTDTLAERGVDVETTDRGGLVTYHGPGQLVGYPILDLGPNASAASYVADLEAALVATLDRFGVAAHGVSDARGVWVGDAKIAAIGVHVSNGITTHGFALNVDPDLSMFAGIVPCGIADKRVTSLREVLGDELPPVRDVARLAADALAARLGRTLRWTDVREAVR